MATSEPLRGVARFQIYVSLWGDATDERLDVMADVQAALGERFEWSPTDPYPWTMVGCWE